MKPTLLFVILAIALASCSEYQYITLSGINSKPTNTEELVFENDTTRITYHFNPESSKTGITIYNKTMVPMEVDWKRSALIVSDKAYSYDNATMPFSGQVDTGSIGGLPLNVTQNFNGTIKIPEPSQFIPPQASVSLPLSSSPLKGQLYYKEADAKKVAAVSDFYPATYKSLRYTESTTPLKMRSHISIRVGNATSAQEISVEHRFFVSELWATTSYPSEFPADSFNRGNRLPTSH